MGLLKKGKKKSMGRIASRGGAGGDISTVRPQAMEASDVEVLGSGFKPAAE